jgi:hypothetical protein
MQSSVVMRDLVDNVLDFARARLGDGLKLDTFAACHLAASLHVDWNLSFDPCIPSQEVV